MQGLPNPISGIFNRLEYLSVDPMSYTLDELTQRALTVGILTPAQLQEIWAKAGTDQMEPQEFLQAAVRAGLLTNYQVDRLTAGDTTGYFFGDYKALYIVGAGTFARVFRSVHRSTGEVAAAKVLRARFSDNETFIKHFLHEAKLGTQLKHPNIVPIHAASSEGYLHYMIMDFVEGQTLREFVKIRKVVDPVTTTQIIRDIASGLEYALRRGLQHRDLKLSNVMLSSTGEARIVDFGLASIAEKANLNVPFLKNQQSVDYVALERSSGKKDDHRSDLYFLGCMYYHMLCGESPFIETKDKQKRLDRSRFYNVRPLQQVNPEVPRAVAAIVEKAMQVEPDARYQSPTAFLYDLRRVAEKLEGARSEDSGGSDIFSIGNATSQNLGDTTAIRRSVMIVDSNEQMQNMMRAALKKAGFRVLVVSTPERALERLGDEPGLAQCVVFNATSLGLRAIKGFSETGVRRNMKEIPSILLLDENQGTLADGVATQPHRPILQMPLTIRQLREKIIELTGPVEA